MSKLFKLKRNSTRALCLICHVQISLSSSKKWVNSHNCSAYNYQESKYSERDYCLPFNIPFCFQRLLAFKSLIAVRDLKTNQAILSVPIFCAKFDSSPIKKLLLFQNIITIPIQSYQAQSPAEWKNYPFASLDTESWTIIPQSYLSRVNANRQSGSCSAQLDPILS